MPETNEYRQRHTPAPALWPAQMQALFDFSYGIGHDAGVSLTLTFSAITEQSMKIVALLFLLAAVAACSAPPPEPARGQAHEDDHYREWQDGGGWMPDYHDK